MPQQNSAKLILLSEDSIQKPKPILKLTKCHAFSVLVLLSLISDPWMILSQQLVHLESKSNMLEMPKFKLDTLFCYIGDNPLEVYNSRTLVVYF